MKPFSLTLLFLTWLLCAATAQNRPDTIRLGSLSETIGKAVRSNPSQAVYQLQIQKAGTDYKATRGALYPHATGEFLGTDNLHLAVTPVPGELVGRPNTTYYVQFGKRYIYNPGVTLSQSLFDWQSVLQTRIAKSTIDLTGLQQAQFEQALKAQVAQLYYSALVANASLAIARHDKELADSVVALVSQRLTEGTTDALTQNQALINSNNIAQNQTLSLQLYDQSTENLKNLLGGKPGSLLQLTETFDPTSLEQSAAIQLGTDKTIAIYQEQAFLATLQAKAQKAVTYPRLTASLYVGEQQFRNQFGLSFGKQAWSGYRYIGVDLTVPIFSGLTNSNRYRSAVTQQHIAQLQLDNARLQSESGDSILLKNQVHFAELARTAYRNFILYGKNLELNKQKFTEGVISMDVYLRSFQDYLGAENGYLNNLSQLLSTKASILSRQ